MTLTPAQLGLIRGIGFAALMAILTFLGDTANLSSVLSASMAAVISSLALSAEHYFEAKGNGALFGAVNRS